MNNAYTISPTDLRDYAKALGWSLLHEAVKDRIYVLTNREFPNRQLVFPMDTTAPDYPEAIELVLQKLSELDHSPVQHTVRRLQEMREDTLSFRLTADREIRKSLPLSFATSMLYGAENLLLSAASTVLKPRRHHPRMSFSAAQQLVDASRFRHTETGSFVLKISCPISALDVQGSFLREDDPHISFVRQSTLTIQRALRMLVSAIETDTVETMISTLITEPSPIVSSNLCEAITRFHDDTLEKTQYAYSDSKRLFCKD
jgi:hypothetical protein